MTGDGSTREQLRAIPMETLREQAREACELASIRAVAAEMGVGRTTLHNFINEGRTPHPRVRRLMALWFVAQTRDVHVNADACAMLVAALPPALRVSAQEDLAAFVRDLHRRYGHGYRGSDG